MVRDATGVWTLEIKDTKAGNGGKLDGFEMEIVHQLQLKTLIRSMMSCSK